MSHKNKKWENGNSPHRPSNGRKNKNLNLHPVVDTKHKESVVRRLAELFQDSFDLDVIQSVAQTCQWDFGKSTEALFVLGGTSHPTTRRTHRVNSLVEPSVRYKTKSLPSTLKGHKSQSGRLSDSSTKSMPNGLRAHPAHFSNDSLPSGQVWQRHYKSKPQSPGLLTMIPPTVKTDKDSLKLQKPGSSRSSSQASLIRETPEVKKTSAVILRIQQLVQNNVKVMVLMRGVPGSGKTSLAQIVVGMVTTNDFNQHIFCTDDYFVMLGRGVYSYDPNQVPQAHNWNQKRVSEALRRATNPVVVDNTHTQAWEMKAYVTMAVQHGYLIEVLEPVTPWKTKEAELARRNVHNVPREKIRQMLDRYEPGWTGEKLLNLFQLKYQHCGAAHVSPEVTGFSDSPLAQHRQHAALSQPEKPKRKKSSPVRKDRRQVQGVEISVSQEQQLDELNKLFAEYGKTMDPESRQKVLDAGVPISEVVLRIRKLQGTLLPIPGVPPVITEEETPPPQIIPPPVNLTPDYLGLNRQSPTDSVEPDTMSSSGGSETSECDSDSEAEPLRRYLDDCVGHFVDGEDQWEDEEEAKSDGAVGGRPPGKTSTLITSSQEELSIIDYQMSTPAGSSQDELSLLEFDRGESPNRSSSSSEEPKTELSTLQDSLQSLLLRSVSQQFVTIDSQKNHVMKDVLEQTGDLVNGQKIDSAIVEPVTSNEQSAQLELNDSLLEILMKRFSKDDVPVVDKSYADTGNNVIEAKNAKSPDLEQIPLPCIPEAEENIIISAKPKKESTSKLETIQEVNSAIQSPPELNNINVKSALDKKDRSPGGILRNFDLNWASIPFTGSWDDPPLKVEPLPQRSTVDCSDHSSQTSYQDFDLWQRCDEKVTILNTNARVITSSDMPLPVRSKSAVAMFDKSSMTDDMENSSCEEGLQDLIAMFPNVALSDITDLLEKCQGDKEWVAELLLDPSLSFNQVANPKVAEVPTVDPKIENIISDGKKTIKRRKDRKGGSSELSLLLKKEIEDSIQIGKEHYTDKVLFYKKLRTGEINLEDVMFDPEICSTIPPSTEDQSLMPKEITGVSPPTIDGEQEEATMPMALDATFFETLVARFGSFPISHSHVTKDYRPIINIPESLARKLYWLWVESVNQQVSENQVDYEEMLMEDERLATALQELELDDRPPNMQEVMDRDLAESLSRRDKERIEEKREDTIASKLQRNLLFEFYPHLDRRALLQVFRSEGLSLKRTCDILNETYGPPKCDVLEADKESKDLVKNRHKPIIVVREPAPKYVKNQSDILIVDPSEFRREIQILQERRSHYLRLGHEAMQKRRYASAGCFFEMASELKEKIQEANQSSISLSLFSSGPKVSTTIDLHYLFIHEAVRVVDLFLDYHIANLQTGRLDLFLVTGRGQRSQAGRSRIKPVVQKRLEERQLSYVEDNPGMLRVTVHPNDLLSSALL